MSVAAALMFSAVVVADEAAPDCETRQREGEVDNISRRTAPLRSATGAGACEGEHWDGQDSTGATPTVDHRSTPSGSQPNINNNGATDALHLRVSVGASGDAYSRADIFGVGAAAVYTSGTTSAVYLQDYSDSVSQSTGLSDEYMLAYNAVHGAAHSGQQHGASDNWLAGVVHLAHITQGEGFGEEDVNCTNDSYETGECDRDNTAATVELVP